MARRPRGTGGLKKFKNSRFWYSKLKYADGVTRCVSTGTTNKTDASQIVLQRKAEIAAGEPSRRDELLVVDLMAAYLRDAKTDGLRSFDDIERRWEKHLKPVFGHLKIEQVIPQKVNAYIDSRQSGGAPNSTINREVAVLQRAFKLAQEEGNLEIVPYFKHLQEDNVREGFLEFGPAQRLRSACAAVGKWMLGIFETGYTFGWRSEEVLNLTVGKVDWLHRSIRLTPHETKTKKGREAYMTNELYAALLPLAHGKLENDPLFTRDDGSEVKDFRKVWWQCCQAAGVGTMACRVCKTPSTSASCCPSCQSDNIGYTGLLFHDMRRTAIRDMVRRGIPEKVAMMISGHKTRSVFDRYHIVSESDLREAARLMEVGAESDAKLLSPPVSNGVGPYIKGRDKGDQSPSRRPQKPN